MTPTTFGRPCAASVISTSRPIARIASAARAATADSPAPPGTSDGLTESMAIRSRNKVIVESGTRYFSFESLSRHESRAAWERSPLRGIFIVSGRRRFYPWLSSMMTSETPQSLKGVRRASEVKFIKIKIIVGLVYLQPRDPALSVQSERHESLWKGIGQLLAPLEQEGIVVPVLQVSGKIRARDELEHQLSILNR